MKHTETAKNVFEIKRDLKNTEPLRIIQPICVANFFKRNRAIYVAVLAFEQSLQFSVPV